jgi:hypothetical protein
VKAFIKFGAFGQYTIIVPITTLGIVDGQLVRGFGYTERGYICGQKLINAEIVAWLS